MTHTPTTESAIPSGPEGPGGLGSSVASVAALPVDPEVVQADVLLAGRAIVSGQYLAGLIAAAQLDTVGAPRKLPADLFPGADPVLVQEIWDRALVVGVRAGRLMGAPRFNRDKLARLQGELATAVHHAMGGMVGRSLGLVERAAEWHPADSEDVREH
jgi:hypothetical protein